MDLVTKRMNVVHNARSEVSGGRLGRDGVRHAGGAAAHHRPQVGAAPHRSAHPPIHETDRVVLIASEGRRRPAPGLVPQPRRQPRRRDHRRRASPSPMRARTATAEEKAELWPRVVAAYKGYAGYQQRTERDIPVVICEPR